MLQAISRLLLLAVLLATPMAFAQEAPVAEPEAPATPQAQTADAVEEREQAELPDAVGWIEVSGALEEAPPPYAWVSEDEMDQSFRGLLRKLHRVASSEQHVGVVIHLDRPMLSWTQVDEISAKIKDVRDAGKQVLVFAEEYDLPTYLVACAADKILLQRGGQVLLLGLSMEEMYLAGMLEKIGADADFIQVGKFKGADETLTRDAPSKWWDQNIDALLDDLYDQAVEHIGKARGLDRAGVEQVLADCWSMQDADYVKRNVVDMIVSRDLVDATEIAFGESFVWDQTLGTRAKRPRNQNPFAFFQTLFQTQQRVVKKDAVALIHAYGPIVSGKSSYGDGLFSSASIGSQTMVEALGEVRDNENIKAAVIRIDSPGGSAIASEMIWQAVRQVSEAKPVYISVGSMAASGGYYIACAGDRVYVDPTSILGSIGVVGGKVTMAGLYDWAGISIKQRSRGPLAGMFNSVEPFTQQQRGILKQAFEKTYDQFIDRVKTGRGSRIAEVDQVAQGRVFTGRQCVANGLADEIGGLSVAVQAAAKRAGLGAGEYQVLDFPEPMTLPEFLDTLFQARTGPMPSGVQATPASVTAAKKLLGPVAWQRVGYTLDAILQLRDEPVLAVMPGVLVVR